MKWRFGVALWFGGVLTVFCTGTSIDRSSYHIFICFVPFTDMSTDEQG